ncbi:MAG: ParB N-terminal domain-containing protein [Chloroflexi bacterium]|nr:ParB N-terminal domain-containing protein [Chloroflexota bacterium]
MDESKLKVNPDGTYEVPDVVYMPLSYLEPGLGYRSQLRGMEEMENSIRRFGVLMPLLVQPHPKKTNCYIIFAGRRRYEAAKKVAREKCDRCLFSSITVQVGRYLIPCRIFRNLPEVNQAILSLTENMARRDPSAIDTARELKRVKAIAEKQTGRTIKMEEILTVLCGPVTGKKVLGKRYLYKLLRIAELDTEVADVAKERRLSAGLLDQVTRLSRKDDQLELVRIVADLRLTENEAREIVNKKLSSEASPLSSIAVEVVPAPCLSSDGAVESGPAKVGTVDQIATRTARSKTKRGVELEASAESAGPSAGAGADDGETGSKTTALALMIERLRGQADVELLHAADVLEAWTKGEYQHLKPGGEVLKHWLDELSAGGHDPEVMERLRGIIERQQFDHLDAELIKLIYMYQGVLPEHLPGYLPIMRESIDKSPWYRSLVTHFLGLLNTLGHPEESKKVDSISRRLLDAVLHELFWLSIVYDPRLQYWVEKLPPQRKKEFARYVRTGNRHEIRDSVYDEHR